MVSCLVGGFLVSGILLGRGGGLVGCTVIFDVVCIFLKVDL